MEAECPPTTLPESRSALRITGDCYESWHRVGRIAVHQRIVPHVHDPGAGRALRLSLDGGDPVHVTLTSSFEPYLLPVLVEGIRPTVFHAETHPDELRIRQRGFALSFRASVAPSQLFLNRSSWIGGRFHGAVSEIGSAHEVLVAPGVDVEVRLSILGGLSRTLKRTGWSAGGTIPDPGEEAAVSARVEAEWLASTPTLKFPAAPELERAYEMARAGLRRLDADPGDDMTGVVAGYPWYSSLWCRDTAWMIPALLWLGDHDWVRSSIASVLRFQARAELDLLGGEAGELPMQIAPGPLFLYRYLRHDAPLSRARPPSHPSYGRPRHYEGVASLDREDRRLGTPANGRGDRPPSQRGRGRDHGGRDTGPRPGPVRHRRARHDNLGLCRPARPRD